ncbi:Target of rapamycin complex 1 subunit mip1 [Fusarium oxysporum f. sp. albedinis]|nr:Target of rapamycin complex 1 subunit mip1 [Fusarium oxysporum f. sp. albedinis]
MHFQQAAAACLKCKAWYKKKKRRPTWVQCMKTSTSTFTSTYFALQEGSTIRGPILVKGSHSPNSTSSTTSTAHRPSSQKTSSSNPKQFSKKKLGADYGL